MRPRRPAAHRVRALACLAAVAAGLLIALPAHAAPRVHPVDTSDGVLGVPRGTVPPVATPDLQGIPGVEQLPGLEVAPLPVPGD